VSVEPQKVEAAVVLIEQRLHDRALLKDGIGDSEPYQPRGRETTSTHDLADEQRAASVEPDQAEQPERQ
jgi:hypothetical protein